MTELICNNPTRLSATLVRKYWVERILDNLKQKMKISNEDYER